MNHNATHLTHPKYRPDIDGLRAIAVLSVVGFHAVPERILGGFIGVDIFFVISGFLISSIIFSNLEHDSFSLIEFYRRRIKRIFPALLVVMIAVLAYGWFVLLAEEYKQLGMHLAGGASFTSNFILYSESGYFDNDAITKPLLHLWSLAIEEQFYIFWPLLLAFVWKRKWGFVTITATIAVISFAISVYAIKTDHTAAFYLPAPRFWELMIGGLLAYIALHKPHLNNRYQNLQSVVGFLLLTIGLLLINMNRAFPGWWALLPTFGTFFIISSGKNAWLNKNILSNRLLVWVGLISYPLYLWHWPVLSLAHIMEVGHLSIAIRLVAVLISFVLAWATFKLIERPIRFSKGGVAIIPVMVVLMVIIGCSGFYVAKENGIPLRSVNAGATYNGYDWEVGYRLNRCFIKAKDKYTNYLSFANYCDGNVNKQDNKPLVMLWGDSHAASIYRGLLSQADKFGYNLAQYTAGGCPPILGFAVKNRPECKQINLFVLEQIKELKPDTIILVGNWRIYDGVTKNDEAYEWDLLEDKEIDSTIQILKSLKVRNIVMIGDLPSFDIKQPIVAKSIFVKGKTDRTFKSFDYQAIASDKRIGEIAAENKIAYISPIDLLCNPEGCLISRSSDELVPLAWDYGHLTTNGSEFLIEKAIDHNMLILPRYSKHNSK